ncbi:MarR family transcriptional regulator [Alcanivorax sp. S71-1-4]|uniref:MarR family winged helix-turn-helix transcriptional regulator n=1 Tax=Alcanivorax sp. S71-1-4 TaxID=1177159 RepID=UPI0013581C67|nr:MarR family winged helix-turn-helix transcriptional regulator [Alcanivorax sp. S71-1-4]KAF0811105.1 MarR family transcriptional regulator [Alcanivorax sp. S71-1-4]
MERRLFFLINMAQRKMFRYVDSECETQLGFSVTQVAAMLFIARNEGGLQKELGAALGLNKPAVTGLCSRMEQNGLIERRPCQQDGRASRLYLSPQGKAVLPKVMPLLTRMNAMLAADFSEQELDVVVRFLSRVMDNFE